MKIVAIHPYNDKHLLEVYEISKQYKDIKLRGFYESFDDNFYLLEGCHRIELAKRYKIPLILYDCEINDKINVQIPGLIDIFENPVFDANGYGIVKEIMMNCNWCGNEYDETEFYKIEKKPYKEYIEFV